MSREGAISRALTSDSVFKQAFVWLCKRRKDSPAHADVWNLRRNWPAERERIRAEIVSGACSFSPMTRVERADDETVHLWSASDAFVLKCLAIVLERRLPRSSRCFHLKSPDGSVAKGLKSRGAKAAVREVNSQVKHYGFVFKTDVRSYYASIDPGLLLDRLADYIHDPLVLRLLGRYLDRLIEHGGIYRQAKGLPRGCPLSPILGGFFLREVDRRFESGDLIYIRYMDDILVLTKTRWKLRRAARQLNQGLEELRLEKSRPKTFIGRTEKGFDFLGYRFTPGGLSLARKTVENFLSHGRRLYEHERGARRDAEARLGEYVNRWLAAAGCGAVPNSPPKLPNSCPSETATKNRAAPPCGHVPHD